MRIKYLILSLVLILIFDFISLISCKAEEVIEEKVIEVEEKQEKDEVDLETEYIEKTTEQTKEENAKKEKEHWILNLRGKVICLVIIIILIILALILWRYSVTIRCG